jgi:hypothetical protein
MINQGSDVPARARSGFIHVIIKGFSEHVVDSFESRSETAEFDQIVHVGEPYGEADFT